MCPPNIYLEVAHIYNFELEDLVGQTIPQNFFIHPASRPPHHHTHTFRGGVISTAQPTGTHVLK